LPAPVLSFNGEFVAAPDKRFQETIVFVPFYKAKRPQLSRHRDLARDLGFDCVLFDLKDEISLKMISAQKGFGLKHVWADQVEKILNEVPGRKIVYAFSNPSSSAIEAIVRRNASDIAGLVCDSGPSTRFLESFLNYYKMEEPVFSSPLRFANAMLMTLAWSPHFASTVQSDMRRLPKNFPVLSIRGWKDPLITLDQIDLVFEPHHQIALRKLSLPKAVHLNGLKDFRDEYAPAVSEFLRSIATPLS
jgi:hypothetical protein